MTVIHEASRLFNVTVQLANASVMRVLKVSVVINAHEATLATSQTVLLVISVLPFGISSLAS